MRGVSGIAAEIGIVNPCRGLVRKTGSTRNSLSLQYMSEPSCGHCEVKDEQPTRYRALR